MSRLDLTPAPGSCVSPECRGDFVIGDAITGEIESASDDSDQSNIVLATVEHKPGQETQPAADPYNALLGRLPSYSRQLRMKLGRGALA